MPKYAIRLKGDGCLVPMERRLFWVWRKRGVQKKGFFATRFVDAPSVDEAIRIATSNLREELNRLLVNNANEPLMISVDEIWEDPEQYERYAPGSGMTWYEG